jgi:hypothetical protein
MSAEPFQYAVLRVVPRVDRGERLNVGVVVYCRTRRFLGCRIRLDGDRRQALLAMAPQADIEAIDGGPISALDEPERFRWIVSPSSTVIQPSEVHGGLTEDPLATLDQIFESQVG